MTSVGATAARTPQGPGPGAAPVPGPGEVEEEDDAEEPAEVFGAAGSWKRDLE